MSEWLPEKGYLRVLVLCFYALLLAGAAFLFFRCLFGALLPFLLSYAAVFCLRPVTRFLRKRARLSEKAAGFVSVLLLLLLIGLLCRFLAVRLFTEASRFAGSAGEYLSDFFVRFDRALGKVPLPDGIDAGVLRESLDGALSGFLSSVTSLIPEWLMKLVSSLPGVLLFLAVFTVSSFYLSMEYSTLRSRLFALLPARLKKHLKPIRAQVLCTMLCYLRAYLIMTLITFGELLIGFLLLGLDYAVLAAALTAVIDLLPVFGVGTVLLPWAVFCFLRRDFSLGVGLIVVCAVVFVLRQFLEPRIVGVSVGMHPLLTLVAMYVGFSLAGVWGLILFPFVLVIVIRIRKRTEDGESAMQEGPAPGTGT